MKPFSLKCKAALAASLFLTGTAGHALASESYRIGSTLIDFDRSAQVPNEWQAWKMELIEEELKTYGLTKADGKKFEQSLLSLAAIIKNVPVLNPALGCSPRLAPALDNAYDYRDPEVKRAPLAGYLLLGCYITDEVVHKRNGVQVKERVIGETRQAKISVNNPEALIPNGSLKFPDIGKSEPNPFDLFFAQPTQVGTHGTFPIVDYVSRSDNVRYGAGLFYMSRNNVQPYVKVGRERFTQALIQLYETKKTDGDASTYTQGQLDALKQQLRSLRSEDWEQQACLLTHSMGGFDQVLTTGTPKCEPIVRLNPALIDPKLPRTSIGLVVVQDFMDIEANAYPNKRLDTWTTLKTIVQTDWNRVSELVGK